MFINFKNLKKEGISESDLIFLVAVGQGFVDYISAHVDTKEHLSEYVKYVKGRKDRDKVELIRLTDKGKSFLQSLFDPIVDEEDEIIFNYLKQVYLKKGKKIGNGAKTKRYINLFKNTSFITRNRLVSLVTTFVNDEENMEWNNILEYCLYKPPTAFETRFNLEESRLYKYYKQHEDKFKSLWENNDKYAE